MSHRSFGSVSGMAECYHLGKGAGLCRFAPIYCETGKGNGVIKGSFTCFGHPELTQARADITQFLNLIIVRWMVPDKKRKWK